VDLRKDAHVPQWFGDDIRNNHTTLLGLYATFIHYEYPVRQKE
jgi:hypothetical protein